MEGSSELESGSMSCRNEISYSPIETLDELFNYGVLDSTDNTDGDDIPPECTLVSPTEELSRHFSEVKIQMNGRRFLKSNCPRTLVCHDFKGGYLDDRYVFGTTNPVNYVFRHWLQTDVFCYFSHKFVTIPPIGWINTAHKHGVQCIGTIITEGDEGKLLCQKLLQNSQSIKKAVQKLCLIAKHYKFDGYLINIENEIEDVSGMLEFVRLLTTEMKSIQCNSLVLWYDAVTIQGELKWQNELNSQNKPFLDVCDGIYLNYNWDDEKLSRTIENARERKFDIFVGVDVFGRGCFGGGGLETFKAVEKVSEKCLSVAIFAPGWTFECHPHADFQSIDNLLWQRCASFFRYRTLTAPVGDRHYTCANHNAFYQVYMSTDFNLGFGETTYYFGQSTEPNLLVDPNGPWFNLSEQSLQPVMNCLRESESNPHGFHVYFDSSTGFLGGGCLRIASTNTRHDQLPGYQHVEPVCPVWVPLNIPLTFERKLHNKYALMAIVAWKRDGSGCLNDINPINIFVEVMKPSVATRKIIRLSNGTEQIAFEQPENTIKVLFQHFIPSKYVQRNIKVPELTFEIKDSPMVEAEIDTWQISCFLVDVNHCLDWNITSLKLGSSQNIFLGLLSLAMLSY